VREIESVLVVGAGAVGAAVAGIIHQREPGAASVLAGGERLARFRRDGFVLNGRRIDFPLVRAGSGAATAAAPADLVIVAVKGHQLAAAIQDMRSCVGPGTLILSLLNGITSEDDLAAAFGREKVPYAMILGIDAMRDGNSTVFSSSGRINFGEARNVPGAWTERVSRIASFFDRTGVAYVVPEDMIRALWYKFMINVGVNQASAVLRAPYGPFQKAPKAKAVMEAPMREVVALSRALGTGLTDRDVDAWYGTLLGLGADAKTSMLQDVEAGRKTEVEAFAGTVVALGAKAGVPTPVNAFIFDLIRAMEAGRGDDRDSR
jgi:2-dehydropantoate 2-reductase